MKCKCYFYGCEEMIETDKGKYLCQNHKSLRETLTISITYANEYQKSMHINTLNAMLTVFKGTMESANKENKANFITIFK